MLGDVTAGLVLLAITVIVHAAGMTALLKWLMRPGALVEERFWGTTWLVVRTAWYLIAIHLVEITVWAMFYWEQRCLPDLQSAVYFSGVTYTTVGYGDLVLPKQWQLLGPLEALTGILMCGLSTGFFFALVSKLFAGKTKPAR